MNPVAADWGNFLAAQVGAAAALAGLVAVAISINLSRILQYPHLPARAAETLLAPTAAFVVASVGLAPGLSGPAFGAGVALIGAAALLVSARAQIRAWRGVGARPLLEKISRALATAAWLAPLIVGGAELLRNANGGFYWVAAGIVISLAVSIWNAWILLVEILR